MKNIFELRRSILKKNDLKIDIEKHLIRTFFMLISDYGMFSINNSTVQIKLTYNIEQLEEKMLLMFINAKFSVDKYCHEIVSPTKSLVKERRN